MADGERKSVRISREELEALVFKSGRPAGGGWAAALLYGAAAACVLLLVVTALPQATVDTWVARLQSGSRAVTQSRLLNSEKLALLKLDDEWTPPLFSVSGTVRNRSNERVNGAEAVVRIYGKGGLITTLVVGLDQPELVPSQISGFRASYKHAHDTEALTHYELSFKSRDGAPVLHEDQRGMLSAH